jgi:CheY-like chemotaxis protein
MSEWLVLFQRGVISPTDEPFLSAVTGQSGEDDRKASMAVGCDGFHVKPVRMKQLDDLVSLHFHNE